MSRPVAKPTVKIEAPGLGLADLCIRRPVFATMLNVLLLIVGWASFRELGVDQIPNVELPIITVTTTLRGASPEEVETSVTKPIEEIINTVEALDELSSSSREGISQVTATFLLSRNRDLAAQDVRDKVNSILARLPPSIDPPVVDKFEVDAVPVLTVAVSGSRDLRSPISPTNSSSRTWRPCPRSAPSASSARGPGRSRSRWTSTGCAPST